MTAPKHLRPATREWFDGIVAEFAVEDHHLRTLQAAAEAWDRCEEARERIAVDGAYIEGRYGLKSHPAVQVERESRLAYLRAVRELNLDSDSGPSRPPGLRY